MIRTFIFDMGNVLVHFSHEKMFQQIGDLYSRSARDIECLSMEHHVHDLYERGKLTDAQYHHQVEFHMQTTAKLADLLYATSNIFTLNDKILPVLDALKSKGFRLLLLSNTCSAHINFIQERWQLLDRFDATVLSYQVGALKPEPEIYEVALTKINSEPHEAFFVDDIAENIVQAKKHGLQGTEFVGVTELIQTLQNKHGITINIDSTGI